MHDAWLRDVKGLALLSRRAKSRSAAEPETARAAGKPQNLIFNKPIQQS